MLRDDARDTGDTADARDAVEDLVHDEAALDSADDLSPEEVVRRRETARRQADEDLGTVGERRGPAPS